MPVTSVEKDLDDLTLVIVADFPVPVERLWDAYADPRQLERFWGPPTFPATFTRHDFHPGGLSNYHMTGPDGGVYAGYWEFLAVDAPHSFTVLDGFAAPDGTPDSDLPTTRVAFAFTATDQGSRLTTTTHFDARADFERLLEMGVEEGTVAAMGQIDDIVADLRSFAADVATAAQILDDTTVRIARVVRGDVNAVWNAYHDPDLVKQWLLGPDGWSMPECKTSTEVGGTYRYVWRSDDGETSFSSSGGILEIEPPYRERSTEVMQGDFIPDGAPGTVNDLTLTPVAGGTLITLVVTYPDADTRDLVLATGMVDGIETSYSRLETVLGTA